MSKFKSGDKVKKINTGEVFDVFDVFGTDGIGIQINIARKRS